MSTSRIRGWAGVALAALGLLLVRAGPGFAVSASAAPGCRDSDACRAVYAEQGTVGPAGISTTSRTATCEGNCDGAGLCMDMSTNNGDGTSSFQCSCDRTTPDGCSGYSRVNNATGECVEFECAGLCPPETPPSGPPKSCQREPYDVTTTQDCPKIGTGKVRCKCN